MTLNELAQELLPSASSEEDKKIFKQLRKLYKVDTESFVRKLKRVNLIRRSEGLDSIHKNEIIGKSVKQDIKKAIKSHKETTKKKEKLKTKLIKAGENCLYSSWFVTQKEVDKGIKEIPKSYVFKFWIKGKPGFARLFAFHRPPKTSFLDSFEIKKVVIPDIEYRVVNNKEIRFPEIKKRIVFVPAEFNEFNVKVKNL
jgi:hypothetical protein